MCEEEDVAALEPICRSRLEPASRVERARIRLSYRKDPSFFAAGRAVGVHHQTTRRRVERVPGYGPMAVLDDCRGRPGADDQRRGRSQEFGCPHALWTTRLLACHGREHGPAEGHPCLARLVQGTLSKILNEQEIKPHQVRYD
jgi:hypothetical protein